jgi:hypothetical protein
MGGRTPCEGLEFLDNLVLMQQEPFGVEIVMMIEQIDEFF